MDYYVTAEEFAELYPDEPAETYAHYAWQAQKSVDNATSGVDGVKKLQVAFPTDENDAEAVRRCFCAVIIALQEIDNARKAQASASGYVTTANGIQPASVRSLSAGGESITFGNDAESAVSKAARSNSATKSYISGVIESYLRGAYDDNGVNLLYGGRYPCEV